MPTYVYRCKKCEHQFESIQKMTDEPLKKCPECNGAITRLPFPPSIVFKGSGFHINDYPSSSKVNSDSGASTAVKTENKTETKAESKTETKTDTSTVSKN